MPSIKAIFGGDATQLYRVISEIPPRVNTMTRGLRQELNRVFAFNQRRSQSTLFNPAQEKDAVRQYGEWWNRTLTDQSISAATRSNRARALIRERAQRQEISAERRHQQNLTDSANPALLGMATSGSRGGVLNAAASGGLLAGLKNRFLGVGAAIGAVYSAIRFVGSSISADISLQRVSNTLKIVSGSSVQAADDLQFLRKESDRIGISFMGSADQFARFAVAARTAGFSSQDTRDVFTSISSASVAMGLGVDQVSSAFLAMEQMLSKGTVSMEELRRQLGNSLPGAMQIMARAYKISVADLFKLVETGSLNSAEAVKKFSAQLKSEINITDDANRTIRDINRMQNAWFFLKAAVGEKLRAPTTGLLELSTGIISGEYPFGMFKEIFQSAQVYQVEAAQARIASMEKEVKSAGDLRAALKALTELHPMQRKLSLDEKEIEDMQKTTAQTNEKASELEDRNRSEKMTDAERLADLQNRKKEISDKMQQLPKIMKPGDLLDSNIATGRLQTAQLDQEILSLQEKMDKKERSGGSSYSPELTSNQRIGAFITGPQMAMLDVNKQQLTELRLIKNAVTKPFRAGGGATGKIGGLRT